MIFFLKTGLKNFFLYGIALFLILSISFPFIITRVLNTSYVKKEISYYVYKKTGKEIDPIKFTISVFPQASLNLKNLDFNIGNNLDISIKFIKIDIDIHELLRGRLNILKITIDRSIITPPFNEKQYSLSHSGSTKVLERVFDFLPVHQESVNLIFKNVVSPYFSQMEGSIYVSKTKNQLLLNTAIKNINISASAFSNPSFDQFLDLGFLTMDELKIYATFNSNGDIQGQCNVTAPALKTKNNTLLFDSDFFEAIFKLSGAYYQIDINPFNLNYPKGIVGVNFLNDPTQETSTLKFSGTHIHVDQARQMSLLLFKDNAIVETLFEILKKGIVPKVTVSFESKHLKNLFNESHLSIMGNIEKGWVDIPETELTASHVYGNVGLNNGILDITANKGMVQNSQIEKGNLSIDLLNYKDYPFHGEFFLDVDLSRIPDTLISLLPDTLLARELAFVHDVSGRVKAKLDLSLKTLDDLYVEVNTGDFSVKGNYDRIPGNILVENIRFKYKPDIIHINHLNAMINDNTVCDLNTVVDFENDVLIKIQSGSGMVHLDALIPWLKEYDKTREFISPIRQGKGIVNINSINMHGPILKPEAWTYDLTGTGTGIDIATDKTRKEIETLSCRFHISNDLFSLKNIQTKLNDLSWMEPYINKKHLDSILVPLNMENGTFQVGTKNSILESNIRFGRGSNVYINLSGETIDSFVIDSIKFFDKGFSDATVLINKNIKKPLIDFKGILNTITLHKIMMPDSFWAKKISDFTEGQPILIHSDKDSTLNIAVKSINLNSILSKSNKNSFGNRRLLPDKLINFKADKLKYKKLTITDIDTKLSLKKDHSYIRLNNAFLCDLKTTGYINLKNDLIVASLPFEAKDKNNIQDLLACLFKKDGFMDGHYDLTFNIESDSPKKDFLQKLSGSLILNADQGRIYKWTLLSRILSILNVSKLFKGKIPDVIQKGFAYDSIFIEADIKNSKIYLTKAIINGQDMTLIFSGWVDPLNDQMDLHCLVAPFKTVDLIVEKIPIINTLLGGRLVSVPLKATGELSDPLVIPLHPTAIGKGLIDMMTDILKAPVKLWNKISGE